VEAEIGDFWGAVSFHWPLLLFTSLFILAQCVTALWKRLEEFLDRGRCIERVVWQSKIVSRVRPFDYRSRTKIQLYGTKIQSSLEMDPRGVKGRENHVARSRVARTPKQITRLDQRRMQDNLPTGSAPFSS
jgi:hypothetical protein